MSGKSILAVSAHPDDVEFTAGGSLARWVSEGWKVYLAVNTDGGKGTHDPPIKPGELAAAVALGVTNVFFLENPDGELNRSAHPECELTRRIRRVRPERIVGRGPWRRYELHPDYRAAGPATLDAILAAGNPHFFPKLIDEGLQAHAVPEVYLFGAEQLDTWVDITQTIKQKLNAIASHRSQMSRVSTLMSNLRACNANYGKLGGSAYAEALKMLHPFCNT